MPLSVASGLGLHHLPMTNTKGFRNIWAKGALSIYFQHFHLAQARHMFGH